MRRNVTVLMFSVLTVLVISAGFDLYLQVKPESWIPLRPHFTSIVHADGSQPSWDIYHGHDFTVTKIQDGNCSIYIAWGDRSGHDGNRTTAITTGVCNP